MSVLVKPKSDTFPDYELSQEAFEVACGVANDYGVKVELIYKRGRVDPLPEARFMIWSILYQRGFTYAHTARLFNVTHGAIHNGVKKFNEWLEIDKRVIRRWEKLKWLVTAGDLANSWEVTVKGTAIVRSNHPLSNGAVGERALAQVESGLVLLHPIRIFKDENEGQPAKSVVRDQETVPTPRNRSATCEDGLHESTCDGC